MAAAAFPATKVCVLSNAYRGEVYSQFFSFDEQDLPVAENLPAVCGLVDALERVIAVNDLTFIGDGADCNAEAIIQFNKDVLNLPEKHFNYAKLDLPPSETPLTLRVLVARALTAADDKRALPYVLALAKQVPKHPDVIAAALELR